MDSRETKLLLTRIDRAVDRVGTLVLETPLPLSVEYAPAEGALRFDQRPLDRLSPLAPGQAWGRAWETAWIRLSGRIPAAWRGAPVAARIDLGGEGLVYDAAGRELQGVSCGSVWAPEFKRELVCLFARCEGGEPVELWIAASANALFGLFARYDPEPGAADRYGRYEASLQTAQLCRVREDLRAFWYDLRTARSLIRGLPEDGVRRARLVAAAQRAIDAWDRGGTKPEKARALLGAELFRPAGASELSVTAVGHAHLDTAWLWPVEETIRKCARTFSSQLDLIDRYPDYVFGASQAQHYAWMKELYPGIYERIRSAVRAGRWEIQGGMWIEADCNLVSGESMVRQLLLGKNFFLEEFGWEADNLWLPDVFGYSAALPQILRRSGITSFLTQKLSWNQLNEFPHHTFRWQGIDGSEVLAHFPPENTYNSLLEPEGLLKAAERFRERGYLEEFVSLFGVGDGGGGPKDEQVELGRRMGDLEGAPRVRFGAARDFFHRLEARRDELPLWVGELYLELHRGTLTTQARVKKLNRELEHSLRLVEMLCSCRPPAEYPAGELDAIWKTVLLNQFHDILPGSSIHAVYQRTEEELREAAVRTAALIQASAARSFRADGEGAVFFNSTAYPYDGPVELPGSWEAVSLAGPGGVRLPAQREPGGLLARLAIPPYSFRSLRRDGAAGGSGTGGSGAGVESPSVAPGGEEDLAAADFLVLENDRVRYAFSADGVLVEALDKEAGREILSEGAPGNLISLYDDHPNDWDAWDIDIFYRQTLRETLRGLRAAGLTRGPVRQGIEFEGEIGLSRVRQRVTLAEGQKRLDFRLEIDWREKHKMLRAAFPVRVQAAEAGFDIQYGYVRRPTHANTCWDKARFEVVGHRYADLSEADYGVALLNDCKYGYGVRGAVLDLCLLRAPTYPDPDADQGLHTLAYALLPHQGDLVRSPVIAEAALFNTPPLFLPGLDAGTAVFPWKVEGAGLSLEVVKRAEKEKCWILRVVETHGKHSRGTLTVPGEATVRPADLMERALGHGDGLRGPVPLDLAPFEIATFQVWV